jgi:hypothetical protein
MLLLWVSILFIYNNHIMIMKKWKNIMIFIIIIIVVSIVIVAILNTKKSYFSEEKNDNNYLEWVSELIKLWKLNSNERLHLVWLDESALNKFERDHKYYDKINRFNYFVLNLEDYPFSLLIPQIEFNYEEKYTEKNNPEFTTQISSSFDHAYTWVSPRTDLFHQEWLYINSQSSNINWWISFEKQPLNWSSFDEKIEEIKVYNDSHSNVKFNPSDFQIYFDESGNIYTKNLFVFESLSNAWNNISYLTWDVSHLKERYLWFWKNMQRAINNWNARVIYAIWFSFVWLKSTPEFYYIIEWNWDAQDLPNMIRVVDLYNEDWTSPFIENN